VLQRQPVVLRMLQPMIKPDRHNTGWPRFSLTAQTRSSAQSYRIEIRCQGQVDSHDARGAARSGRACSIGPSNLQPTAAVHGTFQGPGMQASSPKSQPPQAPKPTATPKTKRRGRPPGGVKTPLKELNISRATWYRRIRLL
jgi:hypothetical protein